MKLLLGLLLICTGATAHAQDTAPKTKMKKANLVIEKEMIFVGQPQKPAAFYILQRTELNFKGLEPQRSFVPLILKSVERDPF